MCIRDRSLFDVRLHMYIRLQTYSKRARDATPTNPPRSTLPQSGLIGRTSASGVVHSWTPYTRAFMIRNSDSQLNLFFPVKCQRAFPLSTLVLGLPGRGRESAGCVAQLSSAQLSFEAVYAVLEASEGCVVEGDVVGLVSGSRPGSLLARWIADSGGSPCPRSFTSDPMR